MPKVIWLLESSITGADDAWFDECVGTKSRCLDHFAERRNTAFVWRMFRWEDGKRTLVPIKR